MKNTKRSWSLLCLNTLKRRYHFAKDKAYFNLYTKKQILSAL